MTEVLDEVTEELEVACVVEVPVPPVLAMEVDPLVVTVVKELVPVELPGFDVTKLDPLPLPASAGTLLAVDAPLDAPLDANGPSTGRLLCPQAAAPTSERVSRHTTLGRMNPPELAASTRRRVQLKQSMSDPRLYREGGE